MHHSLPEPRRTLLVCLYAILVLVPVFFLALALILILILILILDLVFVSATNAVAQCQIIAIQLFQFVRRI